MPVVGVSNFHYAVITKDDATGFAHLPPVPIPGLEEVDIDPKQETSKKYADNRLMFVATALGEVTVKIGHADVPDKDKQVLLGQSYAGGKLLSKGNDVAPYVAIGFVSDKENGKRKFVWLAKGQFAIPKENSKTKTDKVDFQSTELVGTFMPRLIDNVWKMTIDEDDPQYISSVGASWFAGVDGADDTTLPTVTVMAPTNNVATVPVNTQIAWTFSERIQARTVTAANFMVQRSDGSAAVAGTLSLDATGQVVTFKPTANLLAATQYMTIATVGVLDLYGNAMAAPAVSRFTTA